MKVEELIIDGFKSYATRTVVSQWDPAFNAITGLNGSGKSNILDAICFVLGISSMATVRASNLQDLIYKRGQAGVTKASVTIVFDNTDKSKSPIGFESHNKISVTRQIALGGISKYLVNGHRAQQANVLQLFQSVQLNINNPNFLIMQGKITKVLNMKPQEILALIEEAAGTKMYEDRREKAQKTMAKKDIKLHEITTLLQEEIEPKLERLRNDKKVFIDFQTTQSELENLKRAVAAHDFNIYNTRNAKHSGILKEKQDYYSDLKNDIEKLGAEISSLHEDLSKIKERKEAELKKEGTVRDLEKSETEIQKEITRLSTSLDLKRENINEERTKLANLEKQIEENKKLSESKVGHLEKLHQEHISSKKKLDDLKHELIKKEELLSTLSTGLNSKGSSDGGYISQLQEARKNLANCKVKIEQSKIKQQHLRAEIQKDKPKLEKAKQENKQTLEELQNERENHEAILSKLSGLGYDSENMKNLKYQESILQKEFQQLNNELEQLKRRTSNLEFSYSNPTPNFDRKSVKGIAAQLFSVSEDNLNSSTALEVCAGGRLYNVVVDTEAIGAQLLEKGQLRKRVTIIPLNKISAKTLDSKSLALAKSLCPGKVELALNLIGYEQEVSKAMEFIFGSKLICHDADSAKQVTFHPNIKTTSVTLQGDIYDPNGTLSGGSRKNGGTLLSTIQQYNKIEKKLNQVKQELDNVYSALKKEQELYEKTKEIQQKKNLSEHQLKILEKNLESNPATVILKKNERNENEIIELNKSIEEQEQFVEKFELEIAQTQKDMKEFDSNKGSKLKQLKKEVELLRNDISKLEADADQKFEDYESLNVEKEQIDNDLVSFENSVGEINLNLKNLSKHQKETQKEIEEKNEVLNSIKLQLESEKATLLGIDDELNELTEVLKLKTNSHNDKGLEIQKLEHELSKMSSANNSIKQHLEKIIEENEWIKDQDSLNNVLEQYPNINLEECYERVHQLENRYQGMKRKVNANIMSTIDRVEKQEASLKHMIKTIEKDKSKIEETIHTLNDYKKSTLLKTWEKVSADFGSIFADLLPNSFAKLVPPENKEVSDGLEVKVKLGKVWKESLVELSGGQRSLIALSLILALLQFKPAPMYILDEVDAALDLSHTQNIGHIIKTRFKGSQFIVVSLKEGMYTNANRVFRTRFQDGTSIVSIM